MMSTRRWAAIGLAAITALTLTAACGIRTSGSGNTNAPAGDPKAALTQAAEALTKTSYKISMKVAESSFTGATDPAAKNMTAKVETVAEGQSFVFEVIGIGNDIYLKVDFGAAAAVPPFGEVNNKWMHIDPAKLKDPQDFFIESDDNPAGVGDIFSAIVDVQSSGPGKYQGTIDFTKVASASLVDEDVVSKLGDTAKAVPFEATVDDQGRLTSFKASIPASGEVSAQTWEVTFSDFGMPVNVSKPADAVELPQQLYDIFNLG